jgi:hypothetical protein
VTTANDTTEKAIAAATTAETATQSTTQATSHEKMALEAKVAEQE